MNTTHIANSSEGHQQPLKNWLIGVSISDSPDLMQLGMGKVHLQDAIVEFARYLLACGATIAYGGDLRKDGFTKILFDLVQEHNQAGIPAYERIVSFLAWPIHLRLTDDQKAELKKVADFRPLDPPDDLKLDASAYVEPNSTETRYIWARSLTFMREAMNRSIHARLLIGGEFRPGQYRGKYPGIAEEAFLALRDGKPLFLIGGFGGCARTVIEALTSTQPEALTDEFQMLDPNYMELVQYYNARISELGDSTQGPIDYQELFHFFSFKGIHSLNNGLNEEDNQRLFETIYIPEMISLVLKGLTALSGSA